MLLLKMSLIVQRQGKCPVIYYRKVAKVDKCFRADSDQERGDHLHQQVVNGRRGKGGGWPLARNNVKESVFFKIDLGSIENCINLGLANSEFLNFGISRIISEIKNKHICLTFLKEQTILSMLAITMSIQPAQQGQGDLLPEASIQERLLLQLVLKLPPEQSYPVELPEVVEMFYHSRVSQHCSY